MVRPSTDVTYLAPPQSQLEADLLHIGVRIKTVYGATGSVSGVTYKDITLSGITKYGVVIEQDYENGSPTGTPTNG